MNKSFRSGPALHRLIEDAPLDLLARLLCRTDLGYSGAIPGSASERRACLDALSQAEDSLARRLDDEAARILTLSGDGAQDLKRIVTARLSPSQRDVYDAQLDLLGRSLWAFLDARSTFEDAESYHHASQYRGYGKPYAAFEVAGETKVEFGWSDDLAGRLTTQIRTALNLKEDCTASHLVVKEGKDDAALHIVIVRHPGPLLSVAEHRKDGQKDRHYYKPPNEATLFYDPKAGVVEICAESPSVRQDIAVCFAEAALGIDLSNKPLTFFEYDLAGLQQTLSLPWVETPGFTVIRAAITELDLRPSNPLHRLSLKVTLEDDIRECVTRYLASGNPLSRGVLSRATISVRYAREGGRTKTLNVTVSYPNRCNLRSNPDAEKRRIGRVLLEGWGIQRTSHAMSRDEERALFPMLLDLYDLDAATMTERELEAHGFDVQQLIDLRLAEPRGRLTSLLIEEDDASPELVTAAVGLAGTVEYTDAAGGQTWAPGALVRKIAINAAYLRELVLKELERLLRSKAIASLSRSTLSLGSLAATGDAPVYLARGLHDSDVIGELDVLLRGMDAAGIGLILTTARTPLKCLGRNVVVSLHDAMSGSADGPAISAEAILAIYRQRRQLALGGKTVQFLDNDFGGKTLHLPNQPELLVTGAKQALIFQRLVDAFNEQTPIVPTAKLMAGTGSTSPSHAFGLRWRSINGVYICKVGEREGWRLIA